MSFYRSVFIFFFVTATQLAYGLDEKTETFRLRAEIVDEKLLRHYSGEVFLVTPDPRFAITLRVVSMAPSSDSFPPNALRTFGIHSPTRMFREDTPIGEMRDFILTRYTLENRAPKYRLRLAPKKQPQAD